MPADRLWVCHRCKLIGSGMEAGRHLDATGHSVEELTDEMTAAVRAEKAKHRDSLAAGFLAFAQFQRKAAAANGHG